MILHKLTLNKITEEIKILIGMEISEIFTQEKDSMILKFEDEESEAFLEISTDNKYSSIFLRSNFARANKNTVDLFPQLKSDILQDAEVVNEDRIIKLTFIKYDIYCFLFGRGSSNVFLTDKNKNVLDSLENKKDFTSKVLVFPDKHLPILDENPSDKEILQKRELFGKYYTNEILSKDYDDIENEIKNFKLKIENSSSSYLYKNNNEYIVSIIPLNTLGEAIEVHDNLSDGIRKKVVLSKRDDIFKIEYKPISSEIKRLHKKTIATLKNYENFAESYSRAEEYRHNAQLLMSQESPKRSHGKSIEVFDWDGSKLTIGLDEKLNLLENAEKYFEKAKKSEREGNQKEKDLDNLRQRSNKLDEAKNEIDQIDDLKSLNKFKDKYSEFLVRKMKEEEKGPEHKFRFFDIDGWEFYVGKNAKNNDELTMKFAKPNDIWFHARGVGGSHCVLKVPKKTKVPKDIIKRAAEISAYYSQSRNAKYTPVAYCEKKYVRKPKGANPGAVTISKEEVIMVEPKG